MERLVAPGERESDEGAVGPSTQGVWDGHHERRWSRGAGHARVAGFGAPRTSARANRVRWQKPKLFIAISSASRSVWRQANPSVPDSQRVREALSSTRAL